MKLNLNKLIRPSGIDKFRQYLTGKVYDSEDYAKEESEIPDFTDELFVNDILGLTQYSSAADGGTALHKLIELSSRDVMFASGSIINGWQINCEQPFQLVDYPELREQYVSGKIGNVFISGRVDAMSSCAVRDTKTSSSTSTYRYLKSYQWRTYLYLTGLHEFIYDLFHVYRPVGKKILNIKSYTTLHLSSYPEMRADVENVVENYVEHLQILKPLIFDTINKMSDKQKQNLIKKGIIYENN
jgi:hypothetical protein